MAKRMLLLEERVRKLEDENARMKQRQRRRSKRREALHGKLNQPLVRCEHLGTSGSAEPDDDTAPHRWTAAATSTIAAATGAQPRRLEVVEDRLLSIRQHFPFLGDYDMRGRPFVGDDLEKPICVVSFTSLLEGHVVFVNRRLCNLLGYPPDELLSQFGLTIIVLAKTERLLHLLLNTGQGAMDVSDVTVTRLALMQRTGHLMHANVSAQFFYGRTRQVESPPWARQEGSETVFYDGDEEQHCRRLALYREQLRMRESAEWGRIRDTFYRTATMQSPQYAGTC